ncbi:FecR family protein [Prolixibacteraceae bacterium JC049]|nr:FecR family protein [Prolixibacteraceae bacterium JC049]
MELNEIIKYTSESGTNEELLDAGKVIWNDEDLRKDYARLKNVKALSAQGTISEKELKKQLNIAHQRNGMNRKMGRRIFLETLKYAAIFIAALGIGYWLFSDQKPTDFTGQNYVVDVPFGETANIQLPDGSHVWINSGSRIQYSAGFGIQSREIAIDGEAYFDVAKNKTIPFIVNTGRLQVEVTGTQFNIRNYGEEQLMEATLVEGEIRLTSNGGKVLHTLNPEEQAIYSKEANELIVKKVNISNYTTWKDGVMSFEDIPLKQLIRNIELWYNVDVILADSNLEKELFTGVILKNKPLDQILKVLVVSSEIHSCRIETKIGAKSQVILK